MSDNITDKPENNILTVDENSNVSSIDENKFIDAIIESLNNKKEDIEDSPIILERIQEEAKIEKEREEAWNGCCNGIQIE